MKIVGLDGRSPEEHIKDVLEKLKQKLDDSGKVIQAAVNQTVKRHFQTIYPGSTHYSPDKVTSGEVRGAEATTVVDVPGITRAYHDLDIRPKRAKHLAIPMHRSAYGLSPRDVDGLFYVKNKRGTEMLAKTQAGALVVMYLLKDHVHQGRDQRLMPSDQTLADNICARVWAYLQRT